MTQTKFEIFSPAIYTEMQTVLTAYAVPGSKVLDIGPYEGNNEVFLDSLGHFDIDAVDVDAKALEILKAKTFQNIRVNAVEADGNGYLAKFSKKVDMVLSSASIHETNDPANQPAYLAWFFNQCHRVLNDRGIAIVADLFFPDWISDEEVEAFRQYQWEAIHHASNRAEFVRPELIDAAASQNGFQLVMKKEIRAVKEIDRRYYVMVFRKI